MANKFKSAAERQKVRPGGGEAVIPPVIPPVEEAPIVVETPVATPATVPAPEPAANPLANMVEKKDLRKTCSFTLSPDSVKKIEKLAKQNKCSKSMALDLLIQKYL